MRLKIVCAIIFIFIFSLPVVAFADEHSDHSYQADVIEPTCTEYGFTTYTCNVCYDSYKSEYVNPKGHTEEAIPSIAATCVKNGLTEGTVCSTCNDILVEQSVIIAFGHSYDEVVTSPTCTADGYSTYTCTECGYYYISNVIPAMGHKWSNATNTAPKTCTVCRITEGAPLLKTPIDVWKIYWSVEDGSELEWYDTLTKSIKIFLPDGVVFVGYTYECDGKTYDYINGAGEWTVTATLALDTENGYTEDIYELSETEFFLEITVLESEENVDDSLPDPIKDHSKCEASWVEQLIIFIYNFILKYLGKPQVCTCGDKLI